MPNRLKALALASLLAAAVPVADAWAQKELPQNGLIAFSAERAGTRMIFTRQPNGRRLRLVSAGGRFDHPAFSPRGKRLLFTRHGAAGAQLWITYLDGTGLRALTAGPADGMAQWSPTGEEVVFARGSRGRREIYRIVSDGTVLRRLTYSRHDDHSPSWSAEDQIAFVRTIGPRSHVWVMAAAGGTPTRLTDDKADEISPAWSPSGRTLVLARGRRGRRDLYLVTRDGSRTRRLTEVPGDDTEPAWSPDGTRIVFTHRRGGKRRIYLMKVRGKPIRRLPKRSRRVRRLTTSRSRAALPSWQPAGLDPLIAAAGDIACDSASRYFNRGLGVGGYCKQKLTSDFLLRLDLSRVLALGDDQYEDGEYSEFMRSFHLSWGRLKPLIRSVPGNHEYDGGGSDGSGYFDYFNGPGVYTGPAGDRDKGYYGFDIGTWHVIALNSECQKIGGCGPASPQVRWLSADLAAHGATCTMAMWHRPTFTSGAASDEGDMRPAWDLLYAANADLILNGHEHSYERFAPQTPTGAIDAGRGIRQFTAGIGGKSRFGFPYPHPNSQVRRAFFGALELTLHEGSYDWSARSASTGRVIDSGTGVCH